MPTPVGHSLAGALIYVLTTRGTHLFRFWKWGLTCMIVAALADIDFFPALFGDLKLANHLHRYMTHTLLFAVLGWVVALGVLKVVGKARPLHHSLVLFACLASHVFLDLLGKDTRPPIGVPLLWPFIRRSFKLPVELFPNLLKDTYGEIFSLHNLAVVGVELLLLGGLVAILAALKRWHFARKRHNEGSERSVGAAEEVR